MSLETPNTVETLRTLLQSKAKTEPAYRFYSLWNKVCCKDVLAEAYRRCCANAGVAGVDLYLNTPGIAPLNKDQRDFPPFYETPEFSVEAAVKSIVDDARNGF